ncbi:hypothetical protein D3C78_981400 [compost metagenome]
MNPPVKVKNLRLVLINQLAAANKPILQILLAWRRAVQVLMVRLRHGRPVEVADLERLMNIGFELLAMRHKKPMLCPMGGDA